MRSEQEMMHLILETAQKDERIRAALLNGSRANPEAPKDCFQDYDVVYIVERLEEFVEGYDYIRVFGTPLMVQMPERMRGPIGDGRFTYLTLFDDGNRIDLQLFPVKGWETMLGKDSETIPLLDKDGILPPYPPASDRDYHTERPSELVFTSCCNNFWWCMQNVAKGIWRGELPYAMETYHRYVREELNDMASWAIGIRNNFEVSPGKMGKYFQRYLTAEEYRRYEQTYSDGNPQRFYRALFTMCDLFEELALQVGTWFSYPYPMQEAKKMRRYLRAVQALEKDAAELRLEL